MIVQKNVENNSKKGKGNPHKNFCWAISKIKYLLDNEKDVHRRMARSRKINYEEYI